MEVIINDKPYEVPFDLSQIKIKDYIEYNNQYGKELDKHLNEILEKKYEDEALKINLLEDHLDLEALSWYSFWTKFDLIEVKAHPFIAPLLEQYRVLRFLLKDESEIINTFPATVEWNSQTWSISDFKINPANKMSFNEVVTSKEVIRQVHAIGGNKWDGVIYLCAIYFRKQDEPFTDELIQEDSERLKELGELPLKYALSVIFFFECLCKYLADHFSIFSKRSAGESKAELNAFYEEWGWVNFLSSIAETKIFDIPGAGLDSIECAKKAQAYKVLIYASQKKDYFIAEYEAYKP